MGYVDSNLMAGETVVYRAKLHPIRYFWAALWLLWGGLMFAEPAGRGAGAFLVVVGLLLGAMAFIDIATSEFVVTSKRVFLKQGIIRRLSSELLLGKIESLSVEQGIIGRLLDFGTIVPSGSGGTKQGFRKIGKPMVFRQKVNEQIETSSVRAIAAS